MSNTESSFGGDSRAEAVTNLALSARTPTNARADSTTAQRMAVEASADSRNSKAFSRRMRFFPSHLLKSYDPLVPPEKVQNGGTTVRVSLGLKTLQGIDLSRQTVTILGWFTLDWFDERLAWDALHTGLRSLHLKVQSVWTPELVLFNTLLSLDELADTGRDLVVRHDGNVTWWPGGVFKTFCSLDITYYPFDVHLCSLQLTTWTYTMHQINLTISDSPFEYSDFLESSEWTVKPAKVTTFYSSSSPYKTLKFQFKLKRKVLFYLANVLVPILLVSSLNCVVLRVPAGSGEKMTVCLTSFLTFLTYLKVTVDTLPRNSDVLCYFGLYLSLQLVISVFTVAMAATAVWLGWKERMGQVEKKMTFSLVVDAPSRQGGGSGRRRKWSRRLEKMMSEAETRTDFEILRYLSRRGLGKSLKRHHHVSLTSRSFLRKRSIVKTHSETNRDNQRAQIHLHSSHLASNTSTKNDSGVETSSLSSQSSFENHENGGQSFWNRQDTFWNSQENQSAHQNDEVRERAGIGSSCESGPSDTDQQSQFEEKNAKTLKDREKEGRVFTFSQRVERVGVCLTLGCTLLSNASFLSLLVYRHLTNDF